ncbi:hypothetical protein HGM15179_018755 [Zosterops borbonicus]|uniref:Uncharacterized protein n=1 Tax=Zosterops borbonicus TaxID=364589 RepID=A0A8K1DBS3_9PASS|nr:hypothetical protein HGM15179_018755 [Zosterops borbonicus]
MWGTIMAAIKENGANISHYVLSEASSPKPLAPPEPIYNCEINTSPVELPYPEINPYPVELPYPDGNPRAVGPLGAEFQCHEQAAGSLPTPNGDAVIQRWQKCR